MDHIKFEILADGTISIETDEISGANHQSADELLASLADLTGGPVEVKQKKGHVHHHEHDHQQHRH